MSRPRGHYESWFLRANHPTRRVAFWIRYTIFVPHGRPQDAIGELWSIHFDGERRRIQAARSEVPINAPEAFLECATARLKLGPLRTPPMTVVCLRLDGCDYRLKSGLQMFRARAAWKDFDWHFDSAMAGVRIHGRMHAAPEDFVSLIYYNPPGGSHTCLNSKLAACEVTLERSGEPPVTLTTRERAALEILTWRLGIRQRPGACGGLR